MSGEVSYLKSPNGLMRKWPVGLEYRDRKWADYCAVVQIAVFSSRWRRRERTGTSSKPGKRTDQSRFEDHLLLSRLWTEEKENVGAIRRIRLLPSRAQHVSRNSWISKCVTLQINDENADRVARRGWLVLFQILMKRNQFVTRHTDRCVEISDVCLWVFFLQILI